MTDRLRILWWRALNFVFIVPKRQVEWTYFELRRLMYVKDRDWGAYQLRTIPSVRLTVAIGQLATRYYLARSNDGFYSIQIQWSDDEDKTEEHFPGSPGFHTFFPVFFRAATSGLPTAEIGDE